ncbi:MULTISPECIES: lipopolysaccharide biosynthesis protein [Basfia]|uniref:Polysaccharide biosynthesis protein C-terminal domain-containing protein n=1 Tax=Mannheimia succiniciproducens (strain KCTC 0769BP / MBEL55E) TaxID=221988 RepID=Q65U47_MANSM|nr:MULTISPECIES: membrane protein [Basfia]AAU37513.1 unknown [[Mannheimia] succiniciproducens MBEL55E]SEP93999.1 Membrane protein involved in the export of O-antigen and teichoic acid [Basfia succiniciproducens]
MNSNLIRLIFITLLSLGLTLISSFVLARLLSVQDRGLHQLFITAVSYVVTFATGGSGFALALSMRKKQYAGWQNYFIAFLALSVLAAIIAIYCFDFTAFHVLFVLNVVLTAILTMTLEKSKIDANLRVYRQLTLQQPVLLVAVYGICYLLLGEQPLEIAIELFTLFSAMQALACLYYLKKINADFKRKNEIQPIQKRFFLKTWFKQNLLQIFGATTASLDKFLIVYFLGNYTLGLYTVCIAFDSLITKFINMLADYFYSGLLNNINRIKSVLILILLMAVGAVILVPLLAEPIIIFFFSAKYAEVAPVLILFIINAIIGGLSWVLSQNMLLLGKQVLLFTRQIIAIAVFVLLFYLFKDYQLYGVAYAFIGASLTRLIISVIYYLKYPITDVKPEKSAV